jgi:tetratricopeptide (TPR) repeat protein
MRRWIVIACFGMVSFIMAVEPEVTTKEYQLLADAARLDEKSPKLAADFLAKNWSKECSAAIDYALAVYCLKFGDAEVAKARLLSSLEKFPGFSRASVSLARLEIDCKNYVVALNYLFDVVEHSDHFRPNVWCLIGYCHQMMNNYNAAEQAFVRVVVRNPDGKVANRGLLQALIDQGEFYQANQLAERLVRSDPSDVDLWRLQVMAALDANDKGRALVKLLTAEQLGVVCDSFQVSLASLFFQERLYELSAERYLLLQKRGVLSAKESLEAIESFLSVGEFATAEKLLMASCSYSHEQEQLHGFLFCQLLGGQERWGEASRELQSFIEHYPIDVNALVEYGHVLSKLGKLKQAVDVLKRVERIQPDHPHLYLSLAQVYIAQEDYQHAVLALEQALKQKENRSVRRFLDDLKKYLQ